MGFKYVGELEEDTNGFATAYNADGSIYKQGIWKDEKFQYSAEPPTQLANNNTSTVSSEELKVAQQEAEALKAQLAELQAQQQDQQNIIKSDAQIPLITITSASSNDRQGTITGYATDNVGVAEVRVDGRVVALSANGNFEWQSLSACRWKEYHR